MTIALALLAGAVLVAALSPRVWWRLHRTRVDPAGLITAWVLSSVGVLATVVAAIVLLLLPAHGIPGGLIRVVHGCWAAISHGSPPQVEQLGGVVEIGRAHV